MAFMTRDRGPLPPVILLLSILAQVALHRWFPAVTLLEPPITYVGAALIALGIASGAGPVIDFKRSETTVIPFKESSELVVSGMYKLSRNPMYLGMLLILLGVATLTGSLSPYLIAVLFVPILNRRVIRHEEVMLEERFGDAYRRYIGQVRRWI